MLYMIPYNIPMQTGVLLGISISAASIRAGRQLGSEWGGATSTASMRHPSRVFAPRR